MKQNLQQQKRHERKSEKGFTLVELAIVMIIIGLLIGGVLKGQELIENAKVTATISQVKGFQAALNTFRDTYGATPGDMRNATTRIAGCTTGANCANGDGNSLIDSGVTGNDPAPLASVITTGTETVQTWKHLALGDLITGVNPSALTTAPSTTGTGSTTTVTPGSVAWGESHPSSSLRGGYELYYDSNLGTTSGHVLRMSNGGLTGTTVGTTGAAPASALQAANIDRKLDDGRPLTGTVLAQGSSATTCTVGTPAVAASGTTAATPAAADNQYDEQVDQKNCVLYFMIDG